MMQSAYKTAREFLLLEAREKALDVCTPEQNRRARSFLAAANACAAAADDLVDPPQALPAIVLYRQAARLLLLAILIEHGKDADEDEDGAALEAAFAQLAKAGEVDAPPAEVALGIRSAVEPIRASAGAEESDEQSRARDDLGTAVRWLQARVRASALPAIRRSRVVRVGVAALLVLAAIVWLITRLGGPTNLALHKPVKTSSNHPQSVAPADGSGLVNGVRETNYGIQTNREDSPWVMVDLEKPYLITRVDVYNRADGWFDEGLPLVLELSEDGRTFTEVSRRTETFSVSAPWTYVSPGVKAQYVRVRAPHQGYIALSEIEVRGK